MSYRGSFTYQDRFPPPRPEKQGLLRRMPKPLKMIIAGMMDFTDFFTTFIPGATIPTAFIKLAFIYAVTGNGAFALIGFLPELIPVLSGLPITTAVILFSE